MNSSIRNLLYSLRNYSGNSKILLGERHILGACFKYKYSLTEKKGMKLHNSELNLFHGNIIQEKCRDSLLEYSNVKMC